MKFRVSLLCGAVALALGLSGCVAGGKTKAPTAQEEAELTSMNGAGGAPSLIDLQRKADEAYDAGRLLDAEQMYRRLLKATPNSAYVWMRLGNVHLRNDQLDAAANAYRECLRFDNRDARCWQNLSLTYVEMAVATLDQAADRSNDPAANERMIAFKRRLVDSVNTEPQEAR